MGVASAIKKEDEVIAIEKRAEKEEREKGREEKEERGEKGGERKKGSFIGRSKSQPKKDVGPRRVIK